MKETDKSVIMLLTYLKLRHVLHVVHCALDITCKFCAIGLYMTLYIQYIFITSAIGGRTSDANDVTPVDRARTLTASVPSHLMADEPRVIISPFNELYAIVL